MLSANLQVNVTYKKQIKDINLSGGSKGGFRCNSTESPFCWKNVINFVQNLNKIDFWRGFGFFLFIPEAPYFWNTFTIITRKENINMHLLMNY